MIAKMIFELIGFLPENATYSTSETLLGLYFMCNMSVRAENARINATLTKTRVS